MKSFKKIMIPGFYLLSVITIVVVVVSLVSSIKSFVNGNSLNYVLDGVFDGQIIPVIKSESNLIIRPYLSNEVKVGKYFYDYESDEKKQQDSLIFYENTYLQNTGVDYICDDIFDIVSVMDGEVIGIEDNDIYGKIITIRHNDNLISKYGNVDEILVNVGYKISQGEIFAKSSASKLNQSFKSTLHFEVEYKGELIDPENLYTLSVSELE